MGYVPDNGGQDGRVIKKSELGLSEIMGVRGGRIIILKKNRASPDEARLRIGFEGEMWKAKLAVAPRRSYGERSRGARIRTWDPLVPNQVHYRTVLHPEQSLVEKGPQETKHFLIKQVSTHNAGHSVQEGGRGQDLAHSLTLVQFFSHSFLKPFRLAF